MNSSCCTLIGKRIMGKLQFLKMALQAHEQDDYQTVFLSTQEDFDRFLRPIIFDVFQSIDFAKLSSEVLPQTKYMTSKNVGKEFGISEKTLEYWRTAGIGPDYIQVGKRIYYERKVLESFLKSCHVKTTGTIEQ